MSKLCELTSPELQLKLYRQAEEIQKLTSINETLGKRIVSYDRIFERVRRLLNSMPTGNNISDAVTMLMSIPGNYVSKFVVVYIFNHAGSVSSYARMVKEKWRQSKPGSRSFM